MKAKKLFLALLGVLVLTGQAFAGMNYEHSTTGVNGYDLVSYHKGEKPVPGNGNHVSEVDGVTYLFASKENKRMFDKNPDKYIPAYNGYCAYGVAVGKKFVGDPDVWEIVDGKLYLNLDNKIKGIWRKNIPGNIAVANEKWEEIKYKSPASL